MNHLLRILENSYSREERLDILKVNSYTPPEDSLAVVYETNHITELMVLESHSQKLLNYKRISKTEYLDKSTGQIKQYKRRGQTPKSKAKSLTKLKRIVNNNFVGNDNELHITLTYAISLFDKEQLSADFKKFWNKLKYRYPNLEYLCVYERHISGVWHIHCLVKDMSESYLFIPHNELKTLWQQGNIHVNKIYNNNNIGAYFCKYALHTKDELEEYPKNSKLYSCSRGIKPPQRIITKYKDTKKYTEGKILTFHKTYNIVLSDGFLDKKINAIHYMQYNSKIKKHKKF